MKAAIINSWGSPDVFEISNSIHTPIPNNDQVLIKVLASSINPVDFKHRQGFHKYILGAPFPIILGYDVCGIVTKIGQNVSKFKIGDTVFGDLDVKYGGAYAEYAVGTEECLTLKPTNISEFEAAGFPLVSLTALQALRDKAMLQKNQTIIINGASGGVGHIAVQLAKHMGAHVIATCSTKNIEFVKSLGADVVIDYTKEPITTHMCDVFFDIVGNYSFPKVLKSLNPNGTYINPHPRVKILFHKILERFTKVKKVKTLLRKHSYTDMQYIAKLIEEGVIKINIDKTFTLNCIQEAHTYAEKKRTVGKIIVKIE